MKYIIAVILGIVVGGAGIALAAVPTEVPGFVAQFYNLDRSVTTILQKYTDQDTKATCYLATTNAGRSGYTTSLSCVK